MSEEILEDLLVEWELARQSGREASVGELCADNPELTVELQQRIDDLRATAWMLDPSTHLERTNLAHAELPARDDTLPESNLTGQQFVDALESSGILAPSRLQRVRDGYLQPFVEERCGGLAANLVRDGLLTTYQATVLLRGGDDPLLLDRYVILEAIGSGGMGVVYKARHVSMDRIVALKVLPRSLEDASRTIRRFQREIKATARLSHPNIVTALDAHDAGGTHFLVMEYVDGRNLMDVVRAHGPLPLEESVRIIMQVADALAEAHRKGIVHRDIKPSNILLQPDGQAKLLDLGLARISRLNADDITISALTQDGLAMGTEAFMPPEQARDSKTADARADIYSLGCTLFYLVTGRPLFVKRTPVLTMVAHREEPPTPLREVREEAPVKLDALFRRMVSKSPDNRPQSMDEVQSALHACGILDASEDVVDPPTPNDAGLVRRILRFVQPKRS